MNKREIQERVLSMLNELTGDVYGEEDLPYSLGIELGFDQWDCIEFADELYGEFDVSILADDIYDDMTLEELIDRIYKETNS